MKKKILPYLLLTPMILIMGVLVFYPIAATFSYSLKYWKLTAPNDVHFIGFDNYINILKSESFWYSLQNTVFLLVLILFGTTILGVLLSLFLNIEVKFSGVLLAVAVLPWALPPYVNGILWRFIFYPGYGLMNKLLIGMGGRSAGRMAQFEVDTSLCRIHCSNLEEHSVYGAGMSCRKTVDST